MRNVLHITACCLVALGCGSLGTRRIGPPDAEKASFCSGIASPILSQVEPDSTPSDAPDRQVMIAFPVPETLHTALKVRAAQERTTVRGMGDEGTQDACLDVPDAEMADRRIGPCRPPSEGTLTMKTLVVMNEKGGVGKTNLVAHAGWYFAEHNRTLVIDLDQQANLSSDASAPFKDGERRTVRGWTKSKRSARSASAMPRATCSAWNGPSAPSSRCSGTIWRQ